MKPILFASLAAALLVMTGCGRDDNASQGAGAPMKGAEPSPGTKGPGPVGRGGGSGEGSTVGESQNRDTKSGGATSGSK
jgi:hypothetical protein